MMQHRRLLKKEAEDRYKTRTNAKEIFKKKKETEEMTEDPFEEMFNC